MELFIVGFLSGLGAAVLFGFSWWWLTRQLAETPAQLQQSLISVFVARRQGRALEAGRYRQQAANGGSTKEGQ